MNQSFNKKGYLAFDGNSFRDLLVQRLNEGGVFTDQNYEGSHLAALNDIIGYFYSTLVYYLNQTAAGSQFAETKIYENMNRLVRLLNYSPQGRVGQSVGLSISVNKLSLGLGAGNYTIPRYSALMVGGNYYSFSKDVTFSVIGNDLMELVSEDQHFIHQGSFLEYPSQTAIGIDHEMVHLATDDSQLVDHYQIDVYVKSIVTNTWTQWKRVDNLLVESLDSTAFELRFNENKRYEIKFGNGINGAKLNRGDLIQIYYLNMNDNDSSIAMGALSDLLPVSFNSLIYQELLPQVSLDYSTILTAEQTSFISLNNSNPSTEFIVEESVEDIRINAPSNFRSQQRLVTTADFEFFIRSKFNDVLASIKVVNNDDYLANHIRYLYNIGLQNPQTNTNVLLNQIQFANSCNFNNVYVYMVPKNGNFINTVQKQSILNSLKPLQIINSQVVPMDPEYMELGLCLPGDELNVNAYPNQLIIFKDPNTRKSSKSIQTDIIHILTTYFDRTNFELGQTIDLLDLSTQISSVDGVSVIKTFSPSLNTSILGISMFCRNQKYPTDIRVSSQNIAMGEFQYPSFSADELINQIIIQEPPGSIKSTEF